jgi:hypothetical protein
MDFLEHKDTAQRVLDRLVGSGRPRSNSHDNFFINVLQKRFRDDLAGDRSVGDGVVRSNTLGTVNVEGTDPRNVWNFEQVCRVGGVPATNDQDKVQVICFGHVHKFNDSILSLLPEGNERASKQAVSTTRDPTEYLRLQHLNKFNHSGGN